MVKNNIRALVEKKYGMSKVPYRTLVEATGFSRQTIHAHLNNRITNYNEYTINTWCRVLGCSRQELFIEAQA